MINVETDKKHKTDINEWSDEAIIQRATLLAENKISLAEVLSVDKEDIYKSAELAVLFAGYGSEVSEALMDGLMALLPDDEILELTASEMYWILSLKDKSEYWLKRSFENSTPSVPAGILFKKIILAHKLEKQELVLHEIERVKLLGYEKIADEKILKLMDLYLKNKDAVSNLKN